jgi:hypothetical protein
VAQDDGQACQSFVAKTSSRCMGLFQLCRDYVKGVWHRDRASLIKPCMLGVDYLWPR